MSAKLCLLIIAVAVSFAIFFRKIVRADARDDFRIKNILRHSSEAEDNYDSMRENVEKSMNFSGSDEFKTETDISSEKNDIPPQKKIYNEPNATENVNNNFAEVHENYSHKNIKKKKDIAQMIKSFYRGITFAIGLLVSVYSLVGIIYFVQNTDDAIIYSLWLLIGVVLIK